MSYHISFIYISEKNIYVMYDISKCDVQCGSFYTVVSVCIMRCCKFSCHESVVTKTVLCARAHGHSAE